MFQAISELSDYLLVPNFGHIPTYFFLNQNHAKNIGNFSFPKCLLVYVVFDQLLIIFTEFLSLKNLFKIGQTSLSI